MTRVSIRVEANCPAIYDIIDRAEANGILSATAVPFRPGRPGDTGSCWLSDWQEHGFDPGFTPKMRQVLNGVPHVVETAPFLN